MLLELFKALLHNKKIFIKILWYMSGRKLSKIFDGPTQKRRPR